MERTAERVEGRHLGNGAGDGNLPDGRVAVASRLSANWNDRGSNRFV